MKQTQNNPHIININPTPPFNQNLSTTLNSNPETHNINKMCHEHYIYHSGCGHRDVTVLPCSRAPENRSEHAADPTRCSFYWLSIYERRRQCNHCICARSTFLSRRLEGDRQNRSTAQLDTVEDTPLFERTLLSRWRGFCGKGE